jgi:NAD(P) transhydrogenase subunit beta
VGIDYDKLYDMEVINPEFAQADLVIVVGACDVINPAAQTVEGTPLTGMPILKVSEAKSVIVCNRDEKPGYSGVDNILYQMEKVITIWGDASETVPRLTAMLNGKAAPVEAELPAGEEAEADRGLEAKEEEEAAADREAKEAGETDRDRKLARLLHEARKVIIVPGYGMALAQAQQAVKNLIDTLEARGKEVKVGIHPVAGRMPGHMHVLLAEVGIDYEKLYDMEVINPEFAQADLVIVVGACDVINPAAQTVEGTPLTGMPILKVSDAKSVIVCNRDEKPGYSGVDNILYQMEKVITIWGDASETVPRLTAMLNQLSR